MAFVLRNRTRLLFAGSLAMLCFTLLANFYINWQDYIAAFFDYDGSAEIMLAKTMAENGEWIFSAQWNYSSEIRFLHNQLVMAVLFRFTDNFVAVHLVSTVALGLYIAAAGVFCFRSARLPWWVCFFAAALPVTAFSAEWFNNVLSNCYYSFFVADTLLFLGLYLRFATTQKPRVRVAMAVFMLVFSLLMGMCGTRYALLVFMPLALVLFFGALPTLQQAAASLFAKKQTLRQSAARPQLRALCLLALACVLYLAGFLIYTKVLSQHFQVYDMERFAFSQLEEIPDKLLSCITAFLKLFFPSYGLPVLSIRGILQAIKLVGMGAILFCGGALWRRRAELPPALALYISFAWAVFWVNLAACLFIVSPFEEKTTVSARYLILATFLLVPAPVLYLADRRALPIQKLLCAGIAAAVLLVNPVSLHAQVSIDPYAGGTSAAHNPTVFAAVDTLIAEGYTSGYTDYNFNGIMNLHSKGELQVAAVRRNGETVYFSPWLQSSELQDLPYRQEKQFLLFFAYRYDEFAHLMGEEPNVIFDQGGIFAVELTEQQLLEW